MWFLASIIRLHLLLVIGSALWVVAKDDSRILLVNEPEYILHQRPQTQEREPLSSRSDPSNLHDCVQRTTKHEAIYVPNSFSLHRRSSSPVAPTPFVGRAKHLPQIWSRTPCEDEAGVQVLLLLHGCLHLIRLLSKKNWLRQEKT